MMRKCCVAFIYTYHEDTSLITVIVVFATIRQRSVQLNTTPPPNTHLTNNQILIFYWLLPDINLRASRRNVTSQTSQLVSNKPYFDVSAVKLPHVNFFFGSHEHGNKAKSAYCEVLFEYI
jgi:hypothetical protein